MKNITDAMEFYYAAMNLKNTIRQGAVQWGVKRERMEDVASHTWGTMVLAITLKNNLNIDVDLLKVLEMLALHELEEVAIGDIDYFTASNMSEEERNATVAKGDNFVASILQKLENGDYYQDLIDDFNHGHSKEAKFARACDKFDNVLEFKKYVDSGQVDLSHASDAMREVPRTKQFIDVGITSLDDMWFLGNLHSYEHLGLTKEIWDNVIKPFDSSERS